MNIVYIHGAGATPDSFNYLDAHLPHHDRIFLSYNSEDGFAPNLQAMLARLNGIDDIFFIAHSLGGIYALHLADRLGDAVKGVVTLATPFGGCDAAPIIQLFKPCQLYRDIGPHSPPIASGQRIEVTVPWLAVVTTAGRSHLINEPNDGVVTAKSMRQRQGVTFVEVETGHHEILMRRQTVEIIQARLEWMMRNAGMEAC
ncbi:MAG: alpha/beta fold hydrolase [Polaromonas sp.]